ILSNSPPNVWQGFGKLGEPVELVFIAHFAPALVIPVLLAAARVAASRLDVAVWRWTDPDVRPCWRDSESFDPEATLVVANRLPIRIEVVEVFALLAASITRAVIA